jgi:hypothetical protein
MMVITSPTPPPKNNMIGSRYWVTMLLHKSVPAFAEVAELHELPHVSDWSGTAETLQGSDTLQSALYFAIAISPDSQVIAWHGVWVKVPVLPVVASVFET